MGVGWLKLLLLLLLLSCRCISADQELNLDGSSGAFPHEPREQLRKIVTKAPRLEYHKLHPTGLVEEEEVEL
uniref:Putative secreted protein n=1 Tax=Anopheles marajoara TaxID=58244 RepID=A0A2M4CDV5_9DIPT